jgi:asparagine synthase (glutamine-hydrolysing)
MCGICGYVSQNGVDEGILRRMNDTIRYRGPDDEGYYVDATAGLAMRRLSIIDLSTGHQPISNEDGSLWIVFNGEIYNYQDVLPELVRRGYHFRTKSDTEVILHAYEAYGDDCVTHLNGMFAFAIWDNRRKRLFIARDRLGVKPLYYAHLGDTLVFGSELKAVIEYPAVPRDIDPMALDHFLTLEYIPSPRSIFCDARKLPAGHTLVYQDGQVDIRPYWRIPFQPRQGDCQSYVDELTDLLRDAVRIRMIADVPLGAFLSGGIDSSTVVSFMSELSSQPVQTFSIGFGDPTYNELPYARAVAQSFATNHYEEYLEPDVRELAEQLMTHLDEPLGDFSILPTYLVSKVARQQVTVALSGDGGDEVFAGYDTYIAQSMANSYDRMPALLRSKVLPAMLDIVPPQPAKKGVVNKAKRFVEGGRLSPSLRHTRWMMFLNDADKAALYQPTYRAGLNGDTPAAVMQGYFAEARAADALAQGQYVDLKTYLVDDIMTKVDRMSMAVSLEAREPLLDYRIVEFALNLPPEMRLNGGTTKAILRQVMANRLPQAVLNKPKEGFSIPVKHWLKGPLKPMMLDLLSPDSLRRRGYFQPKQVARWIDEHLNDRANHSHRLWSLMVFEQWQRGALEH